MVSFKRDKGTVRVYGRSIIAILRAFGPHFNIAVQACVPDRRSIVTWVSTFRENVGVGKEKIRGITAREFSPKHRKTVFLAMSTVIGSQTCSCPGVSDRSVRRILHNDLHFHH